MFLAGLVALVVAVAAVARVGVLVALVVVAVATAVARLAGPRLLLVLHCVGRRQALQVLDVRPGLPLEDLVPPAVDVLAALKRGWKARLWALGTDNFTINPVVAAGRGHREEAANEPASGISHPPSASSHKPPPSCEAARVVHCRGMQASKQAGFLRQRRSRLRGPTAPHGGDSGCGLACVGGALSRWTDQGG